MRRVSRLLVHLKMYLRSPNPAGELTAHPRPPSWWGDWRGLAARCPLPKNPSHVAFGLECRPFRVPRKTNSWLRLYGLDWIDWVTLQLIFLQCKYIDIDVTPKKLKGTIWSAV